MKKATLSFVSSLIIAVLLLVCASTAFGATVKTRVTGAANWSAPVTWVKVLTGTVSAATNSKNITGTGTSFTTEVSVNDVLSLGAGGLLGTVASITDNTHLVLVANAATAATTLAYGKEAVPSLGDDVQIGNTSLAVATTITLDVASANVNSLVFPVMGVATALTHNGTNSLAVTGNVTVNQASANVTTSWNINGGSAAVGGNLSIGGTATNNGRVSQVVVTTGTLSVTGSVSYASNNNDADQVITVGTGTLTFNSPFTMNSGTLSVTSTGTINFNGGATIGGANGPVFTTTSGCTLSFGGDFTATTAYTLNAGSTSVFTSGATITPTAAITFGHVQINSGATVTLNGNIAVAGNWINNGGVFDAGSATVTFNGTVGQSITGTATGQTFNNITLAKTAGTTLLVDGSTTALTVNNLTETTGNFAPRANLTINGSLTLSAGTFTSGSAINILGNWTNNGGTFAPDAGTVTFANTTAIQTINGTAAAQTFNNLVVAKSGQTLGVGGSTTTLAVNNFTLNDGTFTAPATVNVSGNWTVNGGTFTPGTGTVNFNSTTAAQSIAGTATSQNFNNIVVNKAAYKLSVDGSATGLTLTGNLTITTGTFDPGGVLITASGAANTLSVTGTLVVGAPSFAGNYAGFETRTLNAASIVNYSYANPVIDIGMTYQDLTFSGSGTAGLSGTPLIIQDALVNSGGGVLDFGTNNVTLSGTVAAQSIAGFTTTGTLSCLKTGGTATLTGNLQAGSIIMNGSGGTLNLGTSLTHTISGGLTVTVGTLNAGTASIISIGDGVTLGGGTLNGGSSTINVSGNWTAGAGTFTVGTSTVNFNGSGAQAINGTAASQTFNSLSVTKAVGSTLSTGGSTTTLTITNYTQASGNFTAPVTVNVANVVLSSGTYTSGTNLNVSGNWTNNGGILSGDGTVTFTGSGTISGSQPTTFPALAIGSGTAVGAIVMNNVNSCTSLTFAIDNVNNTLTQTGSSILTVNGNVALNQPTGANTVAWNIDGGSATVSGLITFAGSNTTTNRIAKISLTTGTLNANGGMTFVASAAATKVIDMSADAGTLNLKGALTVPAASSTLTAGTAGSIFNYADNVAQTVTLFSAGAYHNLHINNTSATGATLGAAITASNMTGNLRVQSGTLNNGGFAIVGNASRTFETANGATFRLTGTSGMVTGFGTKTFGASSTVDYAGAAQSVSGETYGHLTLSGSSTKTATAGMTVQGNLSIGAGVTFSAGSFTHSIGGDLINSGTFSASTGTMQFAGASTQTLSGSSISFNNLTMNNPAGLTISGNSPSVGATLTLTSGNVVTGANTLILGPSATVARTSGHVVGNLRKNVGPGATLRTFEIGDANNYAPVTVQFGNVTSAGNLTASTTAGDHPEIGSSGIDPAASVNRYWTLTNSGIAFNNYDATFNFVAGDVDGGSTSGFVVNKYDSPDWTGPVTGLVTGTSIQATGMSGFSSFVAGRQKIDHYLVSATSPQGAGATFVTTVAAQDKFNNTVTGDNATVVTMGSSTGHAEYDSDGNGTFGDNTKTLTAGTFSINTKDNVAETVTLTGSDANGKTGSSAGVVISGGSLHHFAIGAIGPQTAGTPFSISITAQDNLNNTATGFTGTVTISSTGNLTSGAGPTASFVNGVLSAHSVTISNTGNFTLTATNTAGSESGTSNAFDVNPGPIAAFLVEAAGGGNIGTQIATAPFNIRITARDANGNTATYFTGTVDITSTGVLSTGSGATGAFTGGILASHSVSLAGPGNFTITATRTGGTESGISNAFDVLSAAHITTASPLQDGIVGTSYSQTLAAAGGTPPFANWLVISGGLPAGLSLNPATGEISGTPTTPGPSTFTVQVTDAGSQTASKEFALAIVTPLQIATASPLPVGTIGVPYSQTLAGTGGTSPYSNWTVISGSLPANLSLSSATGEISGTPTTAGQSTFTVQMHDAGIQTVSKVFELVINTAVVSVLPSPKNVQALQNFTVSVNVSGVTNLQVSSIAVTFDNSLVQYDSVTPGTFFPSGGFFSSDPPAGPGVSTVTVDQGVLGLPLSGGGTLFNLYFTALKAGSGQIALSATLRDKLNNLITSTVNNGTLNVSPALLVITTSTPLPGGSVGAAYSKTIVAIGGTPPFNWSVIAGALPSSLNLNSTTGEISGVPTSAGPSNFTVQVSDAGSQTASKAFDLSINATAVSVVPASKTVALSETFSLSVDASGVSNMHGSHIVVRFDNSRLHYNGATEGSLFPPGSFFYAVTDADSVTIDQSVVGTPVNGSGTLFNLSFTASNGGNAQIALSVTLRDPLNNPIPATVNNGTVVVGAPTLLITTVTPLPTGTFGTEYNQTVEATGGTPPYSWSVISGTLPAGLTLNSGTGAITGTPTYGGTSDFTIQVSDAGTQTATREFSLKIYLGNGTIIASDNFNRSDETPFAVGPGLNWQRTIAGPYDGTSNLTANKVAGAANEGIYYWQGAGTFDNARQFARARVNLGSGEAGLVLLGGANQAIMVSWGPPNGGGLVYIYWYQGMEGTQLVNAPSTLAAGDIIEAVLDNGVIYAKVNGSVVASVANTTPLTSGTAGFVTYQPGATLDDWEAGTPVPVYTISGMITEGGTGRSGVLVTASGGFSGTATTDGNGYYVITGVPSGSTNIVLTPTLWDHIFTPPTLTIAGPVGGNITNQNFASSLSDDLIAIDNFNRADETPFAIGLNWAQAIANPAGSTANLTSNEVAGASGDALYYWQGAGTFDNTRQFVRARVVQPNGQVGLVLLGGPGQGIVAAWGGGTLYIYRYVGGGYQGSLTTLSSTLRSGDVIEAVLDGGVIYAKINGLVVARVANSTGLSTGKPGFETYQAGGVIDDWEAGTSHSYTISGTITEGGIGVSGVLVTATGGFSGNATTDGTGSYLIAGVQDGVSTIVLTPTKAGYIFSPTTVQVPGPVTGNVTGKDFTAISATMYTISGTITAGGTGLAGVLVTASGGCSGSATTDATGHYSIADVVNGSTNILLTPMKLSYTFGPATRLVSGPVAGNVIGQDFTSAADPDIVALDDFNRPDESPFAVGLNWSQSVAVPVGSSASLTGNQISGGTGEAVYSWQGTGTFDNTKQWARARVVQANGQVGLVLLGSAGQGIVAGWGWGTLYIYRYLGGSNQGNLTTVSSTLHAGDVIEMILDGGTIYAKVNGSVVASVANTTGFTSGKPGFETYLSGGIIDDWQAGTGRTYTISGTITDGTNPVAGATVAATGDYTQSVQTDPSGNYLIAGVPPASNLTITPTKAGYTFSPVNRVFSNISGNQTGQNFTGTLSGYTLTVTAVNGTVTLNPPTGPYAPGTVVTMTATAADGYHFVDWTGNVTGSANPVDVTMDGNKTVTANFVVSPVIVKAKVFLQGAFGAGPAMSTGLNTAGIIPAAQPYTADPWAYNGTETVAEMPPTVVDWVLVELRSDQATKVASRAALLNNDGTLLDVNGTASVSFAGVSAGNYYIVIRHRNHVAIMSANPVQLSASSSVYDFTGSQNQAFGVSAMKSLTGGVFGMYAADANANGGVGGDDISTVRASVGALSYSQTDVDMNGGVGGTDISLTRENVGQLAQMP